MFILYETLPFTRTWVAPFFEETATLGFYVYAGWRFRPAPDNSDYFSVPQDDDAPGSAADGGEGGGSGGGSDDVAISLSTGSSTRQGAVQQTVSKPRLAALEGDGAAAGGGRPAVAPTVAAATGAATIAGAVAIADDDAEDEFGLDEDEDDLIAR